MNLRAPVAVALVATSLMACSDDNGGGYCETLAGATDTLGGADPATLDQDALDALRATAAELYERAPGMVVDDWRTVVASYDRFDATLRDAGLTADDLVEIQEGAGDPQSVDPALLDKYGDVSPKLDDIMSSNELLVAGDAIAAHAATECDIDMTE